MRRIVVCGAAVVVLMLFVGCATTSKASKAERQPAAPTEPAGAVAAGQAVYDANCSKCHRLGEYDTKGRADLTRRVDKIDAGFLSHHHGKSLSEQDIVDLKAFVSAQ